MLFKAPLLVLKGILHYWTYFNFPGDLSKWKFPCGFPLKQINRAFTPYIFSWSLKGSFQHQLFVQSKVNELPFGGVMFEGERSVTRPLSASPGENAFWGRRTYKDPSKIQDKLRATARAAMATPILTGHGSNTSLRFHCNGSKPTF